MHVRRINWKYCWRKYKKKHPTTKATEKKQHQLTAIFEQQKNNKSNGKKNPSTVCTPSASNAPGAASCIRWYKRRPLQNLLPVVYCNSVRLCYDFRRSFATVTVELIVIVTVIVVVIAIVTVIVVVIAIVPVFVVNHL